MRWCRAARQVWRARPAAPCGSHRTCPCAADGPDHPHGPNEAVPRLESYARPILAASASAARHQLRLQRALPGRAGAEEASHGSLAEQRQRLEEGAVAVQAHSASPSPSLSPSGHSCAARAHGHERRLGGLGLLGRQLLPTGLSRGKWRERTGGLRRLLLARLVGGLGGVVPSDADGGRAAAEGTCRLAWTQHSSRIRAYLIRGEEEDGDNERDGGGDSGGW